MNSVCSANSGISSSQRHVICSIGGMARTSTSITTSVGPKSISSRMFVAIGRVARGKRKARTMERLVEIERDPAVIALEV